MATGAANLIVRTPGALVWNPSSLGGAFPYGGTALGMSRDQRFTSEIQDREIWAEEFGLVADRIYGGEVVRFRGVLRYPDNDAINAIANNPDGSNGGFKFRVTGSGAVRPGVSGFTSFGGVLLFAARAATAHNSLILYKAIPDFDDAFELQLSLGEELGIAYSFVGSMDSSGRCYDYNRLSSLSL
jgi:hypothetical protein